MTFFEWTIQYFLLPLPSLLTKVHPLSSLPVFSEVIHAAPEPIDAYAKLV